MMYKRGSFTVPASTADGSMCKEKGHSAVDGNGRCFCCGETLEQGEAPAIAGTGKPQYFELMGGPRDGEIVADTDIACFAGTDALIGGHRYRVHDVEKGLVRMTHVADEGLDPDVDE